ncbi:MAG: hypothetical protein M1459_02125 [Patescibacteria group bacterium]|nr:hypothetical protein [Patescibacteria group bacterium]
MSPDEIKARFHQKFVVNLVALAVILIPAIIVIAYVYGSQTILGLKIDNYVVPSLIVVIGGAIYAAVTWRCPNCRASLGKLAYPKNCPKCGVELR